MVDENGYYVPEVQTVEERQHMINVDKSVARDLYNKALAGKVIHQPFLERAKSIWADCVKRQIALNAERVGS